MDLILKPVRLATSKPARQTYLNTLLFMITSSILLGLAVVAYILFYFNYLPQIGVERVVHLQYGDGPHPYGIATLDSALVSQQPYDISLSLTLPRSPPNVATGNFMLSLSLLSPTYKPRLLSPAPPSTTNPGPSSSLPLEDILFSSRRPAILTYTSRLVSLSERLAALPFYVLGLRHESETLRIPMGESASFSKGWKNVPQYILLELQTGQEVQVYDARLLFTARFRGLRWLMYNHRIFSFCAFVSAFWFAEVLFTALAWLALRSVLSGAEFKREGGVKKAEDTDASVTTTTAGVKMEPDETDDPDLSDTPRTFPTYGRQPPLRYVPKVKEEVDTEGYVMDEAVAQQQVTGEADDEDEDAVDLGAARGGRSDSALGTSFSEGGEKAGLSRRRSRGKGGS